MLSRNVKYLKVVALASKKLHFMEKWYFLRQIICSLIKFFSISWTFIKTSVFPNKLSLFFDFTEKLHNTIHIELFNNYDILECKVTCCLLFAWYIIICKSNLWLSKKMISKFRGENSHKNKKLLSIILYISYKYKHIDKKICPYDWIYVTMILSKEFPDLLKKTMTLWSFSVKFTEQKYFRGKILCIRTKKTK